MWNPILRTLWGTWAILLGLATAVWGEGPPGYWAAAEGRTGLPLKQAIHEIINDHLIIPYAASSYDTSDALRTIDADPANTNNVILVYSFRSVPGSSFGTTWNREHLWANAYGIDDRAPAYSDLHNLRPCDIDVNSERGNKYYDYSDRRQSFFRSPGHAEAPETSSDIDSWMPAASERGDLARAMFYMDVRYEGDRPSEPDLALTEAAGNIHSTNVLFGRLVTLLQWHQVDPVDAKERKRNDAVFGLQRNRNPFVDHPEWVAAIYHPVLQLKRQDASLVRLSWPGEFTNVILQRVSSVPISRFLTNGALIAPGKAAGTAFFDLPIDQPPQYFRLRLLAPAEIP